MPFFTTTPNKLVATINHARMPVLLTREHEFETRLSASTKEAFAQPREYPPGQIRIAHEGFEKKDLFRAAALTAHSFKMISPSAACRD